MRSIALSAIVACFGSLVLGCSVAIASGSSGTSKAAPTLQSATSRGAASSTSSTTPALIIAAVGIIVSGLVGPAFTARKTRKADEARFERERAGNRRDDLRAVLDRCAELLAPGVTNIRHSLEAFVADHRAPPEVADWSRDVFAMEQRLRLRLPVDDPVIAAYVAVREALVDIPNRPDNDPAFVAAADAFESARGRFLDLARDALSRPVTITP